MSNKKLYLSSLDYNPIVADTQAKPPLLLGPWCLVDVRSLEELKEAVESGLSLSPWKKTAELLPDIDYLRQICLHLIPWLGDTLNARHGSAIDNYTWRWLLSMWLQHFLHSALDQWKRIELAMSYHEPLDYHAVQLAEYRLPNTLSFVVASFASPHFHAALASQIIDFMHHKKFSGSHNLHKKEIDKHPALRSLTPCLSASACLPWGRKKLSFARRLHRFALNSLLPSNVLLDPAALGLGLRELIRYPFAKAHDHGVEVILDSSPALAAHRAIQWPGPFEAVDFFEEFVQSALSEWLPDVFWEHDKFSALLKNNKRLHAKYANKKVFFPSASLVSDEQGKLFLAEKSKAGCIVVLSQHGSHYGTAMKYPVLEIEEYEQASLFLTWGWSDLEEQAGNFMPLPALHLEHKARRAASCDDSIMFVTNMRTAYNPRFSSNPVIPEQAVGIIERQARFFKAFPESLRTHLLHQAYPYDYHQLAGDAILRQEFPWLQSTQRNFAAHYQRCRLLVLDYPGTTLYAALAACTAPSGFLGAPLPFILFWDKDDELFSRQSAPLFAALSDCGILHYTPEGAAQAVAEAYNNLTQWWQQPERRKAVQRLALEYAMTERNALGQLKGLFKLLSHSHLEQR